MSGGIVYALTKESLPEGKISAFIALNPAIRKAVHSTTGAFILNVYIALLTSILILCFTVGILVAFVLIKPEEEQNWKRFCRYAKVYYAIIVVWTWVQLQN